MKIPTRPAPSVPRNQATTSVTRNQTVPTRETNYFLNKPVGQVKPKKKPPPRPPPPKINNKSDFTSLIDLSAPLEDYLKATGSSNDCYKNAVQNNFLIKSSNSIDDLHKRVITNNDIFKQKPHNYAVGNSSFFGNTSVNYLDLSTGSNSLLLESVGPKTNIVAPTIIRAQSKSKNIYQTVETNETRRTELDVSYYSPPMPTVPPPSPPKGVSADLVADDIPHGIALYDYTSTHPEDLPLLANDIVVLLRKINDEWLYGKVGENEGMFPANFVDILIPLPEENIVTALYEFDTKLPEDLKLKPGQKVKVLNKINSEWLFGESKGQVGQFPINYIDHVPSSFQN